MDRGPLPSRDAPAHVGRPPGCDRIALVHTTDPYTRLTSGTAGTVTGYDDRLGQLAVAWDDGSTLSMLLRDGDQVRLITPGAAREDPAPPAR